MQLKYSRVFPQVFTSGLQHSMAPRKFSSCVSLTGLLIIDHRAQHTPLWGLCPCCQQSSPLKGLCDSHLPWFIFLLETTSVVHSMKECSPPFFLYTFALPCFLQHILFLAWYHIVVYLFFFSIYCLHFQYVSSISTGDRSALFTV